jgi:hypothetical protein
VKKRAKKTKRAAKRGTRDLAAKKARDVKGGAGIARTKLQDGSLN